MWKWLKEQVDALLKLRFFGTLTLTFRDGRLVNVKKEESLTLPPDVASGGG